MIWAQSRELVTPIPSRVRSRRLFFRETLFRRSNFPGSVLSQLSSINNGGDLAETFIDPDGSFWGMVTVNGVPYQVFSILLGNNDLQQICGDTFDSNGQLHGFIGTLPLQKNTH
jgi:hypothetical protein